MTPFADALSGAKCILVTTYRKTGVGVDTPVWFVQQDDRLLVWSGADAGKVKRVRNDGHVTVRVCTMNGRPTSDPIEATARILPATEGPRLQRLLTAKYGLVKRVLDLGNGIKRLIRRTQRSDASYLEITLPG